MIGKRRLIPTLSGLALVGLLVVIRMADPYPLQVARELAFDLYQRALPRSGPPAPIRVVDIDEASLAAIGQWPWPRDVLAKLTEHLNALGAAAIAYDVLFAEGDRFGAAGSNDARFAQALEKSPSVLGFSLAPQGQGQRIEAKAGFAVSGKDPTASIALLGGVVAPLPELAQAAAGLGSLSLNRDDQAGVVRQVPLLWTNGTEFYPALSLEAVRVASDARSMVILGETAARGYVEGVRVGSFAIPTTSSGDLRIYYRRPDPALYVPAKDILADDYTGKAGLIAGHIVLIGTSASGLLDLHATSLGDNVAGVSIHAQAIDQMLSGQFLSRADWLSGLEIVAFLVAGALLVVVVLRLGPMSGLLAGLAAVAAMAGFSWAMFVSRGMLVDPVFPVSGTGLVYAAALYMQFALSDRDRRDIRRAFSHYVAPSVLSEIERSSAALKLGGEVRDITIMFADMRGFTALSETLSPQQVIEVLNILFGALGEEIVTSLGTIDKFVGDSIMAFWNAPIDVKNHARQALRAALAMRQRLEALNRADAFGLGEAGAIRLGIGLSTGEALVGNMGLETRFDYSCVGDVVNVASRVEGASKLIGFDIVTVSALRRAAPDFAWLSAGAIELKGKRARAPIDILVGGPDLAARVEFAELSEAHEALIAALKSGGDAAAPLARAIGLAQDIEPQLLVFYARLAQRGADFS